jgi:hypothetical protein
LQGNQLSVGDAVEEHLRDPNYDLDNGDLVVNRIMNDSMGMYECTATNSKGSAASQGFLKVDTL